METDNYTRRTFIKALIAIPVVAMSLWRFLQPPKRSVNAIVRVPRTRIPHEGALVLPEERIAVIQREETVTGISLVCTHLGCTVTMTPDEMICPCHGSRFTRDGRVIKGPAERALSKVTVTGDGEDVVVMR